MPRRAISVSFRSAPALLAFVNDVFGAIVGASGAGDRRDAFRYRRDAIGFRSTTPTGAERRADVDDAALGLHRRRHACGRPPSAWPTRSSGCWPARPCATARPASRRAARPADIAILFRSRDSHREFEAALERRGVPTYVYKGLGFFDADEIQDAVALLRYLADPLSDLRAAALLRSRLVRLSDAGDRAAGAATWPTPILGAEPPPALGAARRRRSRACSSGCARAVPRWLAWVDRLPPSELLDAVLRETAYALRDCAARAGGRRART